jgi:hypothetical protein
LPRDPSRRKATVRDIDGLLTGIIDIPVCEDAVDAVELLTATVEDD